jgi:FMN phosphatase YigB (HAD superfamily)
MLAGVIRTLIFDLGGVLVPFDMSRGYAALERTCGCPAAEIPKRLGATDLVHRFETGRIGPRDFVAQISAQLGMRISYEEFCSLWSCIFLPHTLIPEHVIEGLHRGRRLLLLSNTNALHFDMIAATYPLLRHFDGFVLSHEVGLVKPAPEIYAAAVERARCAAHECLFIDDLQPNVEAARAAGLDAVRFENWEALQPELRARDISWE